MELTILRTGTQVRFVIKGDIDEHGAEILKREYRSLDSASFQDAVFDFSAVSHIGSAGIGKLLLFYKDVALKGGKMTIEKIPAVIYDLFLVLKLDTIFSIQKM